ncbi:MAG: hypothetical protein L6Q92_12390 [Phycisphaerae bacterium]|nr:hypothetical protein [Phycisphaerae bacterium]
MFINVGPGAPALFSWIVLILVMVFVFCFLRVLWRAASGAELEPPAMGRARRRNRDRFDAGPPRCPNELCLHENRPAARFCARCGHRLV